MPPFDSLKSVVTSLESQQDPEPEELKKGKEDLKKILTKLAEKEKEIESSTDPAEKKSERYAKIAEVLKTQVLPVLQSWLTKFPDRTVKINKAIALIQALTTKYEEESTKLKSLAAREKLKETIKNSPKKYLSTYESAEIVSQFSKELEKLSEKMQNGDTGILIDGNGQNLFIVKKENGNFSVVTEYKVSTGKRGFTPAGAGGKTPLGLFRITEMPRGQIGQVIATGSTRRKILKDLDDAGDNHGKAVMMTAALHLEGEETGRNDRYHDYRIHGTNYESRIGKPASGGCVRTKNKDMLEIYNFAQTQKETGRELYVYITNRNPYEEKPQQYAQNTKKISTTN